MKMIRYQHRDGTAHFGSLRPDGKADRLEGDIYGTLDLSGGTEPVAKLLARIVPTAVPCIGLNYKKQAAESVEAEP